MAFLLPFVLILALGLLLLGGLVARIYNHSAHGAITRHFQDAEYILQHQRPPPRWSRPRWRRSRLPRFQGADDGERLLALIAYFERSRLVEDEETRAELLRQLRAAGERWRAAD